MQRWRCFLPLHKGEPLPLNWSAPTLGKAKGPSRNLKTEGRSDRKLAVLRHGQWSHYWSTLR